MPLSLMLAAGLTSGLLAPADAGDPITLHRLRSMDVAIRATIDEGCRRSPTFAALVDDLERSSLIVYVEQVASLRDGMRGTLLHGGAAPQYLRVFLKRGMSLERRVVVLAHELQHVREVVAAGIVADAVEMDALFRRIGDKRSAGGKRQRYETAAALRVADTVVADLRAGRGAGKGVGHCPGRQPARHELRQTLDPSKCCDSDPGSPRCGDCGSQGTWQGLRRGLERGDYSSRRSSLVAILTKSARESAFIFCTI